MTTIIRGVFSGRPAIAGLNRRFVRYCAKEKALFNLDLMFDGAKLEFLDEKTVILPRKNNQQKYV